MGENPGASDGRLIAPAEVEERVLKELKSQRILGSLKENMRRRLTATKRKKSNRSERLHHRLCPQQPTLKNTV